MNTESKKDEICVFSPETAEEISESVKEQNDERLALLSRILGRNVELDEDGEPILTEEEDWALECVSRRKENMQKGQTRIRKLTERECFALMGFPKSDCDKARAAGVSKTQLYKQAGNSIVVDVLYYIYKNLYNAMPYLFNDLKVGSYFSGIGAFEKGLDRLFADINSGAAV